MKAKAVVKLLLFACIVIAGNVLVHWLVDRLDFSIRPSNEPMVNRIIIFSMVAYAILLAVPFVPGAEIGLAVMMLLGPKIAGLVYVCTLAALTLSFTIGRFIPERIIVNFLHDLHWQRAGSLLGELEGLDSDERLRVLVRHSPRKLVPYLLRYRYLALMAAINLPGNIIIGGGGGIALVAGLSRLFKPVWFIAAVAVAVSPVPLAWFVFGGNFSTSPF